MRIMVFLMVFALSISTLTGSTAAQEKSKKAIPDMNKFKEMMMKTDESVEVREIPSFFYCSLEITGSYEQHETAFKTLKAEVNKQKLKTDPAIFGIYFDNPSMTSAEELHWEIIMALKEKQAVKPPLKLKEWKFPLVALKHYEGTFNEDALGSAFMAIFKWIAVNGYTPVGPMIEKYISLPEKNKAGEMCGKIEILIPVEKNDSSE